MGVTLGINDIKAVTSEMARYKNMDYTGLSFSFLKRRLAYVFEKLKIRKLAGFFERLKEEEFRDEVKYHMAVKVTEMFRDPGFWRYVRQHLLTELEPKFKVWFPDTPSGEELYSFLILLEENNMIDCVEIVCQHSSEKLCEEIAQGVLEAKNTELNYSNYKRLEESDCYDNYFVEKNGQMRFDKRLLRNCIFRVAEPGINKHEDEIFDFIIFRNSGINYSYSKHEALHSTILNHLRPGGFYAIGVKEAVPDNLKKALVVVDQKESIYRKPGVKSERLHETI